MSAIVFIGDEVSAAGYRLAGVHVVCPNFGDVADIFTKACKTAEAVFITAEYAAHIPTGLLDDMIAGLSPLVMVVEDAHSTMPAQTIEDRARSVLGLEG